MIETDAISPFQRIMKVLRFSEILFSILGIYSFDMIKKPYDQVVKTLSFYFISVSLMMGIGCSAAFIYEKFNDPSQLLHTIIAFAEMIVFLEGFGSYVSATMSTNRINSLTSELQEIVDKGKKRDKPERSILVRCITFFFS